MVVSTVRGMVVSTVRGTLFPQLILSRNSQTPRHWRVGLLTIPGVTLCCVLLQLMRAIIKIIRHLFTLGIFRTLNMLMSINLSKDGKWNTK